MNQANKLPVESAKPKNFQDRSKDNYQNAHEEQNLWKLK